VANQRAEGSVQWANGGKKKVNNVEESKACTKQWKGGKESLGTEIRDWKIKGGGKGFWRKKTRAFTV